MKVALIKSTITYADWYKRPSLGIAYMCSYLQSKGIECRIFDAYFNSWTEDETVENVANYSPDVVGITSMTHEINRAGRFAATIKDRIKTTTVVGGCHITALPKQTLQEFPAFDFGVVGEGEITLLELLGQIQGDQSGLKDVNGIVYRNGGEILVNPSRTNLSSEELNELPFPAYDQYYEKDINALSGEGKDYVIFSGRGCPFNCAFCMQVLGRKIRRRSNQSVLDEMNYAIHTYGANSFYFADEIFLFNNKQTFELLRSMIDSGLSGKITWRGMTRANLVNRELIELAKESGCVGLEMGVESGDDMILKAIGKNITVEQVRESSKIIMDVGIPLYTLFILGHPNETVQTIKKTIDLAVELNSYSLAVGVMVPYPGTKIYDMAIRGEGGYKLLSVNWDHYDKYGGAALELEGLSHSELLKWQKKALFYFYIKNLRFGDMFDYVLTRKSALWYFVKKKLGFSVNAPG